MSPGPNCFLCSSRINVISVKLSTCSRMGREGGRGLEWCKIESSSQFIPVCVHSKNQLLVTVERFQREEECTESSDSEKKLCVLSQSSDSLCPPGW